MFDALFKWLKIRWNRKIFNFAFFNFRKIRAHANSLTKNGKINTPSKITT